MAEKLYYEDVDAGGELTTMVKQPTSRQLVMWASVSGDYNPIHYDKDFAQSRDLPGIVVHGQLVGCFLGHMVTDWAGEHGSLKQLTLTYRRMIFPNEPLACKGIVTKKYIEDDQHFVICSLWAENAKGEKTVTGTAVVILPSSGL